MPGVNGIALCEKLKQAEKTKDIPILMCTAMTEESFVLRALSAGASDYIVKPFDASTVLQKVVKALETPPALGDSVWRAPEEEE